MTSVLKALLLVGLLSACMTTATTDKDTTAGEKMDIDSKEYRYKGYFSAMRKAINLTWNYPKDSATAGHQGVVILRIEP